MYLINKLPSLLSLIIAIFICFSSVYYKYSFEETSIKLAVGIITFYLLGYFIRSITTSFLVRLLKENEEKAKILREYEEENIRKAKEFNGFDDLGPYEVEKIR